MGGYGSGRPSWRSTRTVNECRTLRASQLVRECPLLLAGEDAVTLQVSYSPPGAGTAVEYRVRLQATRPNYGGRRWWLLCPLSGCGRRCAVLYLPPGRQYFGCRTCYRLTYPSQGETLPDRCIRKANKIRRRLGGRGGMVNRFPWKPTGMHWRTYRRLREEAELAELQGMAAIVGALQQMDSRLTPLLGKTRAAEK